MARNPGTNVIAEIRVWDSADGYASAWATEIRGGLHYAADLTARDAITVLRRYEGMMCYTALDQKTWQLVGGITNLDWVEFMGGGAPIEVDPLSLHLDQTTPQTVINGAPIFDMGLDANAVVRVFLDGSDAFQALSSLSDYSKLSLGVLTDPTHTTEYTYIQSVASGTGTLLPISFWIDSGVGAIRAWDITTLGDLFAGGDGSGARNIATTGKVCVNTLPTSVGDGGFFYEQGVALDNTIGVSSGISCAVNNKYLYGGWFATYGSGTGQTVVGAVATADFLYSSIDTTANALSVSLGHGSASTDPTNDQIVIYFYNSLAGTDANMKKWALYNATTDNASYAPGGKVFLGGDNIKTYWGGGKDASIVYDGTDLILNSMEVGAGHININSAYKLPNADGTAGYVVYTDGAGQWDYIDPAGSQINHNLLSATHPDTTVSSPPTQGSLISGTVGTPNVWAEVPVGIDGAILQGDSLSIHGLSWRDIDSELLNYFYLPGRVGGQIGYGSTLSGENLTLIANAGGTPGTVGGAVNIYGETIHAQEGGAVNLWGGDGVGVNGAGGWIHLVPGTGTLANGWLEVDLNGNALIPLIDDQDDIGTYSAPGANPHRRFRHLRLSGNIYGTDPDILGGFYIYAGAPSATLHDGSSIYIEGQSCTLDGNNDAGHAYLKGGQGSDSSIAPRAGFGGDSFVQGGLGGRSLDPAVPSGGGGNASLLGGDAGFGTIRGAGGYVNIASGEGATDGDITINAHSSNILLRSQVGFLAYNAANWTYLVGGAQLVDIAYTLPINNNTGFLKNTAGTWSWEATATPTSHNLLSAEHADTTAYTPPVKRDLIVGYDNGAVTPSWHVYSGVAVSTTSALCQETAPTNPYGMMWRELNDGSLTNYFYLPGVSGGQIAYGDTASGGNLTLHSTYHAIKGKIYLGNDIYVNEANARLCLADAYKYIYADTGAGAIYGQKYLIPDDNSFRWLQTTSSLPLMMLDRMAGAGGWLLVGDLAAASTPNAHLEVRAAATQFRVAYNTIYYANFGVENTTSDLTITPSVAGGIVKIGTLRKLGLYGGGPVNYYLNTFIGSASQLANIDYILPPALPGTGLTKFLQSTDAGVLTWESTPGFSFSVSDTNTIDLTWSSSVLSADLRYQDSNTIDLSDTGAGGLKADVIVTNSVASSAGGINLVNDASAPGATKYYGTDGTSTKGWFSIPSAGVAGSDTWVQYNNSGVFGADANFTTNKLGGLYLSTFTQAPNIYGGTNRIDSLNIWDNQATGFGNSGGIHINTRDGQNVDPNSPSNGGNLFISLGNGSNIAPGSVNSGGQGGGINENLGNGGNADAGQGGSAGSWQFTGGRGGGSNSNKGGFGSGLTWATGNGGNGGGALGIGGDGGNILFQIGTRGNGSPMSPYGNNGNFQIRDTTGGKTYFYIHTEEVGGLTPKDSRGITDITHQSRTRVYRSDTQAIVGDTLILFNGVSWDEHTEFTSTPFVSRFTALVAGYYQVNATAEVASTGAYAIIEIKKNGTIVNQAIHYTFPDGSLQISDQVQLNANDYVEIFVNSATGNIYGSAGGEKTNFSIHKES